MRNEGSGAEASCRWIRRRHLRHTLVVVWNSAQHTELGFVPATMRVNFTLSATGDPKARAFLCDCWSSVDDVERTSSLEATGIASSIETVFLHATMRKVAQFHRDKRH